MFLKKTGGNREEARLSLVRNESIYQAVKEENEEHNYPILALCRLGGVSRAAYYKWLHRDMSKGELENEHITSIMEQIHGEYPDKGYRRIRDDLERYHDIKVNDKRVLRICRKNDIKSTIKYSNNGCTRQAANPQYIAENVLNRNFTAEAPNEKWLTDVTEFHYYVGIEKHKVYLSAILDLYDRRIVSYIVGDSNNNALVFDTFDEAVKNNPDAHPLFHSDRGYQYTNRSFHSRLEAAGMTQSMSRVAKCIDNGPMEGFWGILKRERYYGNRFTSRGSIIEMIKTYIEYYNTKRLQRNLGVLTPMEKHEMYLRVA
ncbi:IS3 family transposase [Lacrimispora sp.]|uniref:IS3 family transposase n=1 Tax=Lacrimispora sp. TaxID=2719234 RepID=UPI0028671F4F|nr:IS3 family transposase [Lacrimispora sp.]MDR7815164.1 IS3 family transposase [Lacrimispora sp.]